VASICDENIRGEIELQSSDVDRRCHGNQLVNDQFDFSGPEGSTDDNWRDGGIEGSRLMRS
jgi:hypothetical protein